jgi:hypothetical protein
MEVQKQEFDSLNIKNIKNIPTEMQGFHNWVNWILEERDGKLTKIPINPKTGEYAKSNDSTTWGTFEQAKTKYLQCENEYIKGVGFVLTGTPHTAIDIDHARDKDTGIINQETWGAIQSFRSYTEITPSGEGIRIIVRGELPKGHRCKNGGANKNIEVYDTDRFITVTGNVLDKSLGRIETKQRELNDFYSKCWPKEDTSPQGSSTVDKPQIEKSESVQNEPVNPLTDEEIISIASKATNGEKFQKIFNGDWTDYPSQSEADQALCNLLAFWTNNNKVQSDRLFRQSLLMRKKWDEKRGVDTYGTITMNKAIEGTQETFKPEKPEQPKNNPMGEEETQELNFDTLALPTSIEISQLEIKVEWIVENLIPKESITLLHSIGGVGKSYLLYQLGKSVADNGMFFGLNVKPMEVFYIDFENPLSEIVDRMKKIGGSTNLRIWHLGHNPAPIRFDSKEWEVYKTFPVGLFIVDSLRSSHLLDENSSRDASLIMAHLKEVRSNGSTIILIHHESKAGGYRGSTAWFDLSDHILKFSRVKKIGSDEDTNQEDLDLPIRLGLGGKSRFSSAMELKPMFFKFENQLLVRAGDPDEITLSDIHKLLLEQDGNSPCMNQKNFTNLIKKEMLISHHKTRQLIKKGEGTFWRSRSDPYNNNQTLIEAITYER